MFGKKHTNFHLVVGMQNRQQKVVCMYVCMFLEKMLDDREYLCICSIGIYQN